MKTMPRSIRYLLFALFIAAEWAFEQVNESMGWMDTKTAEGIAMAVFIPVGIAFYFWVVADCPGDAPERTKPL